MGIILWCFTLMTFVTGSNILIMLPLPFYSHTNTFMPVFKELAKRGHNVTMISPYSQKEPIANWTDIAIDSTHFNDFLDAAIQEFISLDTHVFYPAFWRFSAGVMEVCFQEESVQRVLNRGLNTKFDLLIMEPLFAQESLVALGHKLNIPVVGIYPLYPSPWMNYVMGNEFSSTTIPNFRTKFTDQMSFFQVVDNTLINVIELVTAYFYYFPMQEKLMQKYLVYEGSENRPPLLEMLRNVSLTLIDYHFSIGYVQPLPPNVIPVGGLSLKNADPLPDDLQKYIDETDDGVIYMSFGSHLPVSSLSKEFTELFLKAFGKLKQRVLMKWEVDVLPNKPLNVLNRKWFPQASILAHPKCKLFITHGGLHSLTEASYHGVPIIGVPFFADQPFNIMYAEKIGIGKIYLLNNHSAENIERTIIDILNNPSYKEMAMKRSSIVKDRPVAAIDTAVYWIEFVLRHGTGDHLALASIHLPLYKLYLIDVFIFYLIALVLLLGTLFVFFKAVLWKVKRCFKVKGKTN